MLLCRPVARKTLADLERSAKNVQLDDLLAVLRDSGFTVREGSKPDTSPSEAAAR